MNRSTIPTTENGRKRRAVHLPKAKWVRCSRASDPLSSVAERALRSRLNLVKFYAPLAAYKADAHIEYVHQLRVVTRRAAAALDTFDKFVAQRRASKVSGILRGLRRAAGEARDLDVLGTRLAQEGPLCPDEFHLVWEIITRRRAKAQKRLVRAHRRSKKGEYQRRVKRLLKGVRWPCDRREPTLEEAAPELLRPTAEEFFRCIVTGDDAKIEALHTMRIAVKHLRYTIELLAGGFPSELQQDVYPMVEKLAARLGQLNDHATAHDVLERWRKKHPDVSQLATLAAYETQQLELRLKSLAEWWTSSRASDLRRRLRGFVTEVSVDRVPRPHRSSGEFARERDETLGE